MEGPSLVILRDELAIFKGQTISLATGNSKIDYDRVNGNKIKAIKCWGKHLLIQLSNCTVRIHFLMFGSYRINEEKAGSSPRLHLEFTNGSYLNFYTTAVRLLDGTLNDIYDWSADVMSKSWDPRKARKKLKALEYLNVGDALLDQTIFAGVGNIIKNEVLFRLFIHPDSAVGALPPRKLTQLVAEARQYSFDFYRWKKDFVLKKNWQIYTKKKCPRCNIPVLKEYTGKTMRRSFFCANCQKLFV
jgi:endonuclease-8